MPGLVTATGVLAFLADEEPELKVFALQTLNDDIDTVWFEVASALGQIEALYEDESFPERKLAALVLAKVYYHLQAYDESMFFALAAGELFKLDNPGEFEETIISKCVDHYIATKNENHTVVSKKDGDASLPALATAFSSTTTDGNASALISPTTPFSQSTLPSKSLLSRASTDNTILEPSFEPQKKQHRSSSIALTHNELDTRRAIDSVIERLFESCLAERRYQQVVGIAVEAKRLDVVSKVIQRADDDYKRNKGKSAQEDAMGPAEELLDYCLNICMDVVQERAFRDDILQLILDILTSGRAKDPDYFSIAKCIVYLNKDEQARTVIQHLVKSETIEATAIAYQFAFDLYDNGTQEFLGKVISGLPKGEPPAEKKEDEPTGESEREPLLGDSDAGEVDEKKAAIYKNIRSILDGTKTIKLNLEFLYRNNRTDLSILNKVRDSLEGRHSIFHTAVTFCNAFMNQGTTNDKFFRDNLEWLGKAVNWSKFTATAALGVIHRGNLSQSRKLLEPYLPRGAGGISGGSPYSQGGALYAYGLIHANHGADALDYLKTQFIAAEEEVIQHGGALGLGLAGMASGNEEIFENLKAVLYADSALNGEAVGLAMGLIMLGTGNVKALEDMVAYAHETSHEKSVRGLALGMALIMYGQQEGADVMIEGLLMDPDPSLRYGGIMTVAMAYCGTGSNKAIRKLLHVAVSDVNDDVRRIAVMSLGFILFRKPGSVPRMVELLSESYNPHVRYGSAMALGISCAGTGLDEAIDLLEPMMKDPTDFVRQGALIALAMIMIQQNEVMNPKVASIRKTLKKVVGDRHEDAMTKFGAALALGIIDAGGRNCTIGLQTQTGNLNMAGIVGMAVFTQYWYWFPFTHFLSLAFSPTSIIALDHELDIIDVKFHCATKPSLFDYPPEQEVKAEEGPAMIATAILSTTAQAKRRAQKKEKAQRRESMDIDSTATPTTSKPGATGDKMEVDTKTKPGEDTKDKKDGDTPAPGDKEGSTPPADIKKKAEKEKPGYDIENMSRVLPAQLKYISLAKGRYWPVKLVRPGPLPTGGPILLHDTQPDKEKALIEEKLKKVATEKAPVAGAGSRNPRSVEEALLSRLGRDQLATPSRNTSGAAAGAGVLTAIDEDGEGDEEAQPPHDFEYYTDEEEDD
ncbi:26S proteasome regulatory complex, non-ATPase subcomplex, Rpn2/Psmd1 subunit [Daldinia loculata]|uniref:26S proteasome regulatory complex, non-ATPase subcomplex, Rpn2/Psmd1 subunit n=1 Tax=Daldinia loculata TaxID=103429 RepID=UPI0020C3B652|nr:26S proteasome regulatory complex, non-ATPase subcomplex, Rpn2/Psmd1 subunit [Daldinia loculata]KAI1647015.1 26S proteasome regulatory complex, non-ATPase subcomplex, Rpn2/Psmd1 subunit [Daldinia loculata]KAI2783900.1 26S proteasome regulatory complex, non-ATPase subcomplex, Rpn2/Psmd1 subunit [Daldinia loculata]